MDNLKKYTGFIDSAEIDALVDNNIEVNGGTTIPCGVVSTVLASISLIYTTKTAGACPTSACTKSC